MLAVMPFVNSYAEDDFEAEIKADFVSQYIWRGQDVGILVRNCRRCALCHLLLCQR